MLRDKFLDYVLEKVNSRAFDEAPTLFFETMAEFISSLLPFVPHAILKAIEQLEGRYTRKLNMWTDSIERFHEDGRNPGISSIFLTDYCTEQMDVLTSACSVLAMLKKVLIELNSLETEA